MTTVQIITFILQMTFAVLCGISLASVYFIEKHLKSVLKNLKNILESHSNILDLIKDTNEDCKEIIKCNIELARFNSKVLDKIADLYNNIYFVKRYMVRRKKPIND